MNTTLTPTYQSDIHQSDFPAKGSRLVYGTSGLGGVWGEVQERESIDCILYALENGITSFDTAPSYSNAEEYLGKALREWKGERPFISTKVGRLKAATAFDAKLDYSPEGMRKSLLNSLDVLGVEQVDLLFLHEPQWVPIGKMDEILEALLSFKETGYIKMLGIGGNPSLAFTPYIKSTYFQVISTFAKMDACNLSAFDTILPITQQESIHTYAASALHFSLLGNRFKEYTSNPPAIAEISKEDILNALSVNEVANRINIPLASMAQRYLFSMKEATRVVMGARKIDQIQNTIIDWKAGALPVSIFNEITNIITAR
jgi:aryl-alcohol dehydrogenase-like predicted oxidoreductase